MERIGLEPGTEIGGYRIVHQLGAGAMGVVYRATDGGGNPVAFKILRSNILDAAELRERLIREASSLRKVSHPAVAALLDVEIDADETFIVTELVEGPTLESFVADNGPLNPSQLAALAERLGSALEAVHAAGVVHRDLKPNNVLMGKDGAVLIDFGIAHGMQDPRLTATGLVVGTPGYLAPELINGSAPSQATDLWGWAAVLTFAATGRAPFGYGGFEAVIARAMAGKPDVDGLDERISYALRGALAVKPEHRWAAHEVIEELKEAAATPGTVPIFYAEHEQDATRAGEELTQPLPDLDATQVRAVPAPPLPPTSVSGVNDGLTAPYQQATAPYQQATDPYEQQTAPIQHVEPMPPTFTPVTAAQQRAVGNPWDHNTLDEYDGVSVGTEDQEFSDEQVGYQRELPRVRWVPFVAAALAALAFAAWAPLVTGTVLVILFLIFSIAGVSWDALQSARERKGVRKREGLLATLAFPWHVVKGVAVAIPSLVFSAVVSLAVAAGIYFIGKTSNREYNLDSVPLDYRIVIVAVAGLLFLVLAWYGPLTRHTRTGGRLAMQALFPGAFATMLFVLLLLGAAGFAGFVVISGADIAWWPLQEAPSFSK